MIRYEDFRGKVALVTGSSGGVGLRAAEMLAANGAHVVINSRTTENGERSLGKLKEISSEVSLAVGDTGVYDDAVRIAETAAKVSGGIDVLISSGARSQVRPMPFAAMTGPQLVEAFNSRFFARMFPVQAALPYMKEKGGSVVLMGTDAARHPTSGESIVGAYGAAVILMTKTLAKELSRWKIRVNGIALTITSDTPSWERIFGENTFQTNLFAKAVERFPQGRAPTAEEVARVALFLASEENSQVTGQTISVNGGLSFGGW
jgi:3-oxoacyl-[acyl-carrier protein] reductase